MPKGSGSSEWVLVDTGFGKAGAVGSGPSASVFVESGYATSSGVGSGSETKSSGVVYTKAGYAVAGTIGGNPGGVRESITLTTGNDAIHALFRGPGNKLFGSTRTAPARFIKWDDYHDLSTYSVLIYTSDADDSETLGDSGVYDATTDAVYVCFQSYFKSSDSTFRVKVAKVNYTAMTYTVLIDYDLSGIVAGTPAICVDGTYLYMVTGTESTSCKVMKFDLSTGAFVSQRIITGRKAGHTITQDATYVYCGGPTNQVANGVPWAARVPKDMSTQASISVAATNNMLITDDSCLLGGYYWQGLELGGHGNITRVAQDMSSYTTVNLGVDADCYGITTDGTYLYAAMASTPGKSVRFDTSGTVIETLTMNTGENAINEVQIASDCLLVTCWAAPAQVIRIPLVAPAKSVTHIRSGYATSGSVGSGASQKVSAGGTVYTEAGAGVASTVGSGASQKVTPGATYTKTGFGIAGMPRSWPKRGSAVVGLVGSGVSVKGAANVYIKTGYATAPCAAFGSSASIFVESGYVTAGGIATGARGVEHTRSGNATAGGLIGSGPRTSVYVETGAAVAGGLIGAGPSASTFVESGFSTVGGVAAGPSESIFVKSGFSIAGGLIGAGPSESVFVKSGYATVGGVAAGTRGIEHNRTGYATVGGLIGSGPSASIFVKSGLSVVGNVASGADQDFPTETGFATVGGVGSGRSSRAGLISKLGYATVSGVGAGPSESIFVESGSAVAGSIGTGSRAEAYTKTGYATTGGIGSGSELRAGGAVKTGYATVGGVASGLSESVFVKSGYAVAGTVGSGSTSRAGLVIKTGYATAGSVGSGPRTSEYGELGNAITSTIGAGSSASIFVETGYSTVGGIGAGQGTRAGIVSTKSGYSITGGIGTGSRVTLHIRSSYATIGDIGAGRRASVFVETGRGLATLTAGGRSASIFVERGGGSTGGIGAGKIIAIHKYGAVPIVTGRIRYPTKGRVVATGGNGHGRPHVTKGRVLVGSGVSPADFGDESFGDRTFGGN